MKIKRFKINDIERGRIAVADTFVLRLRGLLGRMLRSDFLRGGSGSLGLRCAALLFRRGALGRLLLGRLLFHRGRLRRRREDLFEARRLIVLGHILKNHIQLIGLQNLHVVFWSCNIIRENLRDHLGSHAKVFRNLVNPVFDHTHTSVLLLSFLLPPLRSAVSRLRRSAFSERRAVSSASAA